jgi:hypothetical protein
MVDDSSVKPSPPLNDMSNVLFFPVPAAAVDALVERRAAWMATLFYTM